MALSVDPGGAYFVASYQRRQFGVAGERVTSALANAPAKMTAAAAKAITNNNLPHP
jgi:hypothetical protein